MGTSLWKSSHSLKVALHLSITLIPIIAGFPPTLALEKFHLCQLSHLSPFLFCTTEQTGSVCLLLLGNLLSLIASKDLGGYERS